MGRNSFFPLRILVIVEKPPTVGGGVLPMVSLPFFDAAVISE